MSRGKFSYSRRVPGLSKKYDSMRILVTGSQGYIGTELVKKLIIMGYRVNGLDIGYFVNSKLDTLEEHKAIKLDLREQESLDLRNYDAIIHLAALSNDPLGEIDQDVTFSVNRDAAINLAVRARNQGVSRFVFVSTQSIYGISDSLVELREDAPKNPITAYARSKWDAEQEILGMSTKDFSTVAVRPSTVFGWGSRIRNDIIFNNMILSGLKSGKIEVHTDGTPHRPIIHISDVVNFFVVLLRAPNQLVEGQAYNLGRIGGNHTVLEIAQAASKCLGGVPIIVNTENLTDPRSYKVSFEKAKDELNFVADKTLEYGGAEIIEKFGELIESRRMTYFQDCSRLSVLKNLIHSGQLQSNLRWV